MLAGCARLDFLSTYAPLQHRLWDSGSCVEHTQVRSLQWRTRQKPLHHVLSRKSPGWIGMMDFWHTHIPFQHLLPLWPGQDITDCGREESRVRRLAHWFKVLGLNPVPRTRDGHMLMFKPCQLTVALSTVSLATGFPGCPWQVPRCGCW